MEWFNLNFTDGDLNTLLLYMESAKRTEKYYAINIPLSEEVKLTYSDRTEHDYLPSRSNTVTVHIIPNGPKSHINFIYGPAVHHVSTVTFEDLYSHLIKLHVNH